MSPKVYTTSGSPPCRATMLTVKALDIEVDYEEVRLQLQEQLKPGFLKLNPHHTIPTLKDGDFVIWDSHAINAYLVGKYGKDDSLYPKDLQRRAVIDQRLYFDAGILFPRFADMARPLVGQAVKIVKKEDANLMIEAYAFLEILLEESTYVAGEELSIADFSIVATVTSAAIPVPIDASRFPKTTAWISRMQSLPYYEEANQKGLDVLAPLLKN